jgi:hypothetical protein
VKSDPTWRYFISPVESGTINNRKTEKIISTFGWFLDM